MATTIIGVVETSGASCSRWIGLVDDVARDPEQQRGVGQGGQDLQPVPAEGAVHRGGAARWPG